MNDRVEVGAGGHVPIADRLHGREFRPVTPFAKRSDLLQQTGLDHFAAAFVDPPVQLLAARVDGQVQHSKGTIRESVPPTICFTLPL